MHIMHIILGTFVVNVPNVFGMYLRSVAKGKNKIPQKEIGVIFNILGNFIFNNA